jgi:hypothetical protein
MHRKVGPRRSAHFWAAHLDDWPKLRNTKKSGRTNQKADFINEPGPHPQNNSADAVGITPGLFFGDSNFELGVLTCRLHPSQGSPHLAIESVLGDKMIDVNETSFVDDSDPHCRVACGPCLAAYSILRYDIKYSVSPTVVFSS